MYTIKICNSPKQIRETAAFAKEVWEEHYTPLIGADQVAYMVEKYQSEKAIASSIQEDGCCYFLLYDDDRLIGYCGVQPEKDQLFLSKLYLHREYRGKGLSHQLLDQATSYAKQHGLNSIYLHVNKGNLTSLAAYDALGFIKEEDVCSDIGNGFVMDDYVMRLQLA